MLCWLLLSFLQQNIWPKYWKNVQKAPLKYHVIWCLLIHMRIQEVALAPERCLFLVGHRQCYWTRREPLQARRCYFACRMSSRFLILMVQEGHIMALWLLYFYSHFGFSVNSEIWASALRPQHQGHCFVVQMTSNTAYEYEMRVTGKVWSGL